MIKITFLRDVKARFGTTKRLHCFPANSYIMAGSVGVEVRGGAKVLSFTHDDMKYTTMVKPGQVIITIP